MSKANLARGFTLTDEKLGEVKQELGSWLKVDGIPVDPFQITHKTMSALVHRLDAAERCLESGLSDNLLAERVRAWLRSKGLPPSGDGEKGDR